MRVSSIILLFVLFGTSISADAVDSGSADDRLQSVASSLLTAGSFDEPVYLKNVEASKPSQLQEVALTAGSFDEPVYLEQAGVLIAGTADHPENVLPNILTARTLDAPVYLRESDVLTAGTADEPVYLKTDTLTAGTDDKPVYLQKTTLTAGTQDVPIYLQTTGLTAGTADKPVYLKSNVLTAGTNDKPVYLQKTALTAGTADEPVYLKKSGLPTAGTADEPTYLSNPAVLTAHSADEPTYLKQAVLKASAIDEPVYLKSAVVTAGTADKPVYLERKTLKASARDEPLYLNNKMFTASSKDEPTYLTTAIMTASSADEPVYLSEAIPASRAMLQDSVASTFKTLFGQAMSFGTFLEKTLTFATNKSAVAIVPDVLIELRQQALQNELPVIASAGTEDASGNAKLIASAGTVGTSQEPAVRGSASSTLASAQSKDIPMYLRGQQTVVFTPMKTKAQVFKALAAKKIRQRGSAKPVLVPCTALAAAAGTAKASSIDSVATEKGASQPIAFGRASSLPTTGAVASAGKVVGSAGTVEGPSQPIAFGRASSLPVNEPVAALASGQAGSVVAVGSVNDTAAKPLATARASSFSKAATVKDVPEYLQSGKPLRTTAMKSKDLVLKGLAMKNRKPVEPVELAAKAEVSGTVEKVLVSAGTVKDPEQKVVLTAGTVPEPEAPVALKPAVEAAAEAADEIVKPIAAGSVKDVPEYLQDGRIPVSTVMKSKDEVLRALVARKAAANAAAGTLVEEQPVRRLKMRRLQSVEA